MPETQAAQDSAAAALVAVSPVAAAPRVRGREEPIMSNASTFLNTEQKNNVEAAIAEADKKT